MDDLAGAADAALTSHQFVTPTDVLVGLGWLDTTKVDAWRKGFVTSLDRCIRAQSSEVTEAIKALGRWALDRDLKPWATDYSDLHSPPMAIRRASAPPGSAGP